MVPNQEVLTADGAAVRVSTTMQYRIQDPVVVQDNSVDPEHSLYLVVQVVLRELIADHSVEDLLKTRGDIAVSLTEACRPRFAALGFHLEEVLIRDLVIAGDMKRAITQVLVAQKLGQAALERARAESASLRSLANAARLLENNPALLQLRMLQAVEEGKATVVLDSTGRLTPLPRE